MALVIASDEVDGRLRHRHHQRTNKGRGLLVQPTKRLSFDQQPDDILEAFSSRRTRFGGDALGQLQLRPQERPVKLALPKHLLVEVREACNFADGVHAVENGTHDLHAMYAPRDVGLHLETP